MLLNVPMKKQRKGSFHCGIACLRMIMQFYGDDIPYSDLLDQLKEYKRLKGIYVADIGSLAIRYGYSALMMYHNPHVLDKDTVNLSEKDLSKFKEYLTKVRDLNRPFFKTLGLRKVIRFMENGGRFSTKLPNLSDIDLYLNRKIPVMLVLNNRSLRLDPKRDTNHYVVVAGKRRGKYILNDPSPNPRFKEPYEIDNNRLLHAWYLAGTYMLVLHK